MTINGRDTTGQGFIYIPKWKDFQHPDAARSSRLPWIKDYTDQLNNQGYLDLPLAYRAGLQDIRRLVAEVGQGRCSARADYLQKRCSWPAGWSQKILERLIQEGFIEVRASKARAPGKPPRKHKIERGSNEPLDKETRASSGKPQAAAAARSEDTNGQDPERDHELNRRSVAALKANILKAVP